MTQSVSQLDSRSLPFCFTRCFPGWLWVYTYITTTVGLPKPVISYYRSGLQKDITLGLLPGLVWSHLTLGFTFYEFPIVLLPWIFSSFHRRNPHHKPWPLVLRRNQRAESPQHSITLRNPYQVLTLLTCLQTGHLPWSLFGMGQWRKIQWLNGAFYIRMIVPTIATVFAFYAFLRTKISSAD